MTFSGLGHAQVLGDVDGTNITKAFLKDQHGLQIIFRGLLNLHGETAPFHCFYIDYHDSVQNARVQSRKKSAGENAKKPLTNHGKSAIMYEVS